MLVLCPNCRRKSRVKNPPASLTTLKIRCAVCKHIFVPVASDLEEETALPIATATESGFRGTTKSIDVSDIVRQSFVGPNPLRAGNKTDMTASVKRASGATFSTNTSFVGGTPRVKTDISLSAPMAPAASSAALPTPPPAPVMAPTAQGAPTGAAPYDVKAAPQKAPLSAGARNLSYGACVALMLGLTMAVWVAPRLPGWRFVGRWAPQAQAVATSEVPGLTLTGAQFLTWGGNEGSPFLVVLGQATVPGNQPLARPDVVVRLVDEHGQVAAETRAPFGVSPQWEDVVGGRTAPVNGMGPKWLFARGLELGPLLPHKELGFRVALAFPADAPATYRREAFLVARGAQPLAK